MKKVSIILPLAFLLIISLSFQGCLKDKCENRQTLFQWTPIVRSASEMRVTPQYESPRALKNPGKIYFFQNYVLVNEQKEGIHVFDNSNPAAPTNLGFLNIVGNVDMAIKGNYLYADSYLDLLTLDITTLTTPQLKSRAEGVFQNQYTFDPSRNGWIVDYKREEITQTVECNDTRWNNVWRNGWERAADNSVFSSQAGFPSGAKTSVGSAAPASSGVGGSFARFVLYKDYFYAINRWELNVFNVSNLANPVFNKKIPIGWNIETLYPYGENLFIGSQTGMFIYSLRDASNPVQQGSFSHWRACDPVVVEGNTAYVTLHSGTVCQGFNNQMDVINVTSLTAPSLIKTYPMKQPKGLSVMDKVVYLCDEGLKILNVEKPNDISTLAHLKGFDTYDVIAYKRNNDAQKVLLVIGADGLYQFDVTDSSKPKELSKIQVVKN
jgi:hypothetical protein